jgi:oleate hydratase
MKLYVKRFIHHIGELLDFKALRFTKYNQYESMILPMIKYLESFGVQFHYGVKVVNAEFDIQKEKKAAKRIIVTRDGKEEKIDLTENDLVFVTNGGCVENSSLGDPSGSFQQGDQGRRRLGHVAEDRGAGPVLRPPRQILL